MAVLEKIRVQMGIFITVLIAIALISFIIDPGTLQSAMSMFSSKNDVGEMNGKSITYMEYAKKTGEPQKPAAGYFRWCSPGRTRPGGCGTGNLAGFPERPGIHARY